MIKILIVDDENGIRQILNKLLRLKGYEAMEAESGEQALKIISCDCSVVLLDMLLQGMDSLVLLEKLLAINPKLTVIMMSGGMDEKKIKKAMELGASGFIIKPFDFFELESMLISKLKNR